MVDLTEVLGSIDMAAIPLPNDKFKECEYFLGLAERTEDRDEFRWLLSAFLGAAYSYLETKAQSLCNRYYDEQSDAMIPDEEGLEVLRNHVRIFQDKKKPNYVKTSGKGLLLKQLYEHRKENIHNYSLPITTISTSVPEGYGIGAHPEKAIPALKLCRDALDLFRELESNT
jgi:hypothetical protein